MASKKIALLTAQSVNPIAYRDEAFLHQALKRQGQDFEEVVWDAPNIDWDRFDQVVVRSTWDYVTKCQAFLKVLRQIEASRAQLINPLACIEWNIDKAYLFELEKLGERIPKGLLIKKFQLSDLAPETTTGCFFREHPGKMVIKPCIGAGGGDTFLFESSEVQALQLAEKFSLLINHDVLIQEYLPQIKQGERSLVFIDGALAHALIKVPTASEFRCQEEHGGQFQAFSPLSSEVAWGERLLQKIPVLKDQATFIRVDYLLIQEGEMVIMEIEAIEPSLYFSVRPESADQFVSALMKSKSFL
jgi:glutathione synthase/RimK-type ligase-like ATP-grasp enzyme